MKCILQVTHLCCIGVGCARIFVHHLGPEEHRWDQLLLLLLLNHGHRLTVRQSRLLLLLEHCGVNEQRSQRDSGIVTKLHLHCTGIHHLTTLGHYQLQVVIVLGDHILYGGRVQKSARVFFFFFSLVALASLVLTNSLFDVGQHQFTCFGNISNFSS